MLTPSCVAAVDILINGQTLSAQAQRSALTHFAICPLLHLLLLFHQLHLCARWPSSLPGQVLPRPNVHAPSYIKVHKLLFRRGNIHPALFRISRPKFDMEANQPFQRDNLIITPPCAAAPKSDRGRVSSRYSFRTVDLVSSQCDGYLLFMRGHTPASWSFLCYCEETKPTGTTGTLVNENFCPLLL